MLKLIDEQVFLVDGQLLSYDAAKQKLTEQQLKDAYKGSMAHSILAAHNKGETVSGGALRLEFDCLTSHDITYVGIIQTARASGLAEFPLPYVLTNCHNSLCAVGGTINEDDHVFGLSAAKKYGGIFVPPHLAVIHQYMREMMAGCGKMILGSDSHTRYGALGTMAIGEGGPELVKQILKKTYDINYPDVVLVNLKGKVRKGVGPQDVALKLIGETFSRGFVKNAVLEFVGEGVEHMSVDFRCGIDVMTTETTCLSSIWQTDDKVRQYFKTFGRSEDFKQLQPQRIAAYARAIEIDLSKIEPMIALPFHPSNVFTVRDVIENASDIFTDVENSVRKTLENPDVKFSLSDKVRQGKVYVQQGIIAGCAGGTYENLVEAAAILRGRSTGSDEFMLSIYPSSQPIFDRLAKMGLLTDYFNAGAVVKTAFCGPCFGAGDTPSNNALSIRHTTRNFPSREGSKPNQKQISSVALMDARSIAATAANGGVLTSALGYDYDNSVPGYEFNREIYFKRVYNGFKGEKSGELRFGPNICDWPQQVPLGDNLLIKIVSAIFDDVTTTDELIPSGETSSYRSNPLKLAEFTLSRKDPKYVERAKAVMQIISSGSLSTEIIDMCKKFGYSTQNLQLGSSIFAKKPGDGSAREQAASCQRVLGAIANIANEYATKRYRSNLINWGMLPLIAEGIDFAVGDYIYVPNIRKFVSSGDTSTVAKLIRDGKERDITLRMDKLTDNEKSIILCGCLINYYRENK